jgi:hypothetical protein
MDAPSDRHMRAGEIRVPDRVADELAARVGKGETLGWRANKVRDGIIVP